MTKQALLQNVPTGLMFTEQISKEQARETIAKAVSYLNAIPIDSDHNVKLVTEKAKELSSSIKALDDLSKEYYEERKKITEQISQVIEELNKFRDQKVTTRLKDIWESMFNLTSSLRNEDGIFDGSLASDVIQKKVREFDEEIEKIKTLS